MNDVADNLQAAIYTALTNSGALADLVSSRIYDNVPQETVYPYVAIGDDTINDGGSHTAFGHETTVTIHAWSQYAGRKEVKQIMEAIYDLLHQGEGNLSLSGHRVILCRREFAETLIDPDGRTHHGISRFRVITRRN